MLISMPRVEKVTVSLPKALLDYVERQRALTGANRSETVAEMLWESRRQTELRDREAQYRAAYAVQPETEEEEAFTSAAAADLFAHAGDEWADVAPSNKGTGRVAAKGRGPTHGTAARSPVGKAAKSAPK
jgi:hypothetical protein